VSSIPRPWVANLDPYVPGVPAKNELGRLASNESPLGPSPLVIEAVAKALPEIHRYPDPMADELRHRLARELGVDPSQILVGNGSDELIYLLVMAYGPAGSTVVVADPPYRIHEIVSQALGASLRRVPLRNDQHDLDAMLREPADLCFICNPHNPTGTTVSGKALEEAISGAATNLVVIDEAYVDFARNPAALTALPLTMSDRVVVLRTFSKIHSLAGLRIGYLVGPADVVDVLRRIRAPFSVNALAQVAAVAALDDKAHAAKVRDYVIDGRAELRATFEEFGYDTIPSETNFVLVLCPEEDRLVDRLALGGVSVRPGRTLGIPGSIRVTVPPPGGLELLRRALASTGAESP
jgi:histidinol-phosphate aminotransferase